MFDQWLPFETLDRLKTLGMVYVDLLPDVEWCLQLYAFATMLALKPPQKILQTNQESLYRLRPHEWISIC